MNKIIFPYLIFVFVIIVLYGIAYANVGYEVPSGDKIFIESKCNSCHSVEAENIEAKVKKNSANDLSDIDIDKDAEFLAKYLTKSEKINNKLHPVLFKGSKEELNELTSWLKSINNKKCCN
jgi:hypothetical protein